jgi:MFS family permease
MRADAGSQPALVTTKNEGEVGMAQMTDVSTSAQSEVPWYKSLTGSQWRTLIAANLGWLFDGYETYALILTVGPAMHSLLQPSQYSQISTFAGTVISITLLGWGIGGIIGGVVADYFGRRRTMIYAILAYSIMTGLTALSFNWISFAILRLLVGIAIGSEWATGTSMLAELWPQNARGKGAGLMQCGLGIGFFLASFIWLILSGFGPEAWRYMFVIGILPALVTVWIRTSIDESHAWQSVDAQRKDAQARKEQGAALTTHEQALTRFTVADLFVDPTTRRYTIIVFLMSLTTTLAWWGISSWVPPYIGSVAAKAGLPAQQWASYAGMAYNVGAIAGYASLGFLADRFGRKPVVMIFFLLAFLMTPVLFLWTQDLTLLLVAAAVNAFFTLGQYSWMPVWLPELFPTRSRATGLAFTFNAPRFIAFLGPLYAGVLITQFGGFSHAAMTIACIYALGFIATPFLPETNGKPLPA